MRKVLLIILSIIILPCLYFCITTIIKFKNINKDFNYIEEKEKLKIDINKLNEDIKTDLPEDLLDKDTAIMLENINNYIEDKNKSIEQLNTKNENLKEQKASLEKQYNNLVYQKERQAAKLREEEERKNTVLLSNVPTLNQYAAGYPTGCESAALTLLLKYYGVNVSISQVVNLLAKGDLPYTENGITYGGNPYIEFVGHPSSASSYGVYEAPIKQVADQLKSGIISSNGKSLNEILEIVEEGRPVIVWNSMYLALPYVSTSWIYKPTGEKINWLANEHALLIVGYNNSNVITSDSLTGTIRYYNRSTFESRYNYFGKRALYY